MSNYSKSAVRTITPIVVGYIVALLIKAGIHVTSMQVMTVLGPVSSAVYYLVVRAIEQKFPKAGMLLGHPAAPEYTQEKVVEAIDKLVAPEKTSPAKASPATTPAKKASTAAKKPASKK